VYRFLQVAILWLLLLLPASATVLIYKGTGVNFVPTNPNGSATEGCYVIVDLNSGEISVLTYDLFLKKRTINLLVEQQTLDTETAAGSGNRNYGIFANVVRDTAGAGLFADQVACFRGLDTSITVSGYPGDYIKESYPRTLVGIYRYAESGLGLDYTEHSFTLGYDQADTVIANNASQAIAAVETSITQRLVSAGYQF
jgi:hypothetical protein